MEKIIGIYGIVNKVNQKIYVGQSIDMHFRLNTHKLALRKVKHYNEYLQNAFNKYGENNFSFVILEECKIEELVIREQYHIDHNDSYNIIKDVTCSLKGIHNPFYGKTHTNECKKIMSLKKKDIYLGEKNPNYGKKQPLDVRLKMVKNNSMTKLKIEEVLEIKKLLKTGMFHKDIAKLFNVSRTVVTRINSGNRWKILEEIT